MQKILKTENGNNSKNPARILQTTFAISLSRNGLNRVSEIDVLKILCSRDQTLSL